MGQRDCSRVNFSLTHSFLCPCGAEEWTTHVFHGLRFVRWCGLRSTRGYIPLPLRGTRPSAPTSGLRRDVGKDQPKREGSQKQPA